MRWTVPLCLLACTASPAFAEPAGTEVQPTEETPFHPPELQHQVALTYPDEAEGLHGDVSVLVDVDETGRVTDARFEQGPEVFSDVALEAARTLHFAPATRGSQPVPATTRVRFHFAPPPPPGEPIVEEIVVHAEDPALEDVHARTTIDERALERAAGQDLATTVSQVPGARKSAGTADASKPILRGQQERRLLVLFDGVRHESQKWGPDHGTEIDPFAAGQISVVRGAAGAAYGPDAIGGVILVEPPPLRTAVGVGGKAMASFATNGTRPYGALRLDAVPAALPNLTVRVEANASKSAALRAPDYVLGNTASHTLHGGSTVAYRWDHGLVKASVHRYSLKAGIFYGVRLSTPDAFRASLEADRPLSADAWTPSFDIDRPYQQVTHDIASLHGTTFSELGTLSVTYAYQHDHRLEFEQARASITGPQYDFLLRTHSLNLAYEHPIAELSIGELSGGLGAQAELQENVYRGLSLLPNYRHHGLGVYATERLSLQRVDLEVALRHDVLSRTAFMAEGDYDRHIRRDTLQASDCEGTDPARCPASYSASSASAGALLHLVPDAVDLKVDLSTATRFPDVDELYLIGTAPSFPVYAVGSPSLRPERAYGGSVSAGLRQPWVEAELSGFGYHIDQFVYFAPELGPAGVPVFDVTITGTFPRYSFTAVDARSIGTDGSLSLGPSEVVGLDVRGAVVRIQDRATGDHLVGTPPDLLHVEPVARPAPIGPFHENRISVPVEIVGRQSRVDPAVDLAPAPDAYVLFGLSLTTALDVGKNELRMGVEVHNALNTAYRDYNSLLRYYADQPGRDVRFRLATDF